MMDTNEILNLTPDELRVAVAEKKGWRLQWVGSLNGDKEFIATNPGVAGEFTIFLSELPDLSDPREYMALMDWIWALDGRAELAAEGVYYGEDGFVSCEDFTGVDRGEAIAKAWLIVCGSEDK